MEPDEAELLRAHGAGDEGAFARLYDRYDRSSFLFIRRMLGAGQAQAAEDLHQETWLAVARSASQFDARRASFAAWLYTIARRKVLDHLRRRKVVLLGLDEDNGAMSVRDPGPTPAQQLESRQLVERLVAAVEALPEEQRDVFVLFADAGLSLEEIAEVTGVVQETAKSRLRYARARLRQALADEWGAHV